MKWKRVKEEFMWQSFVVLLLIVLAYVTVKENITGGFCGERKAKEGSPCNPPS